MNQLRWDLWIVFCFVFDRYLIDFNKWEVFVNDDCTRSFLSLEITTSGLSEVCCTTKVTLNVSFMHSQHLMLVIALMLISFIQISKQIDAVNEVYKLHNLPEFYKVHLLFYIKSWLYITNVTVTNTLPIVFASIFPIGSTAAYIIGLGIGWY